MKKLSLILALILTLIPLAGAQAEDAYKEAPMLTALVEAGELPALSERIPAVPKIADELSDKYLNREIGNYGGSLRTETTSVNWSAQMFMGSDENLLTQIDMISGVITPNILGSYESNEDYTQFTFKLRDGLKWSDGTPVTMDDYKFAINDVLFNETLNPVLGSTYRTGNTANGAPMVFEPVDETTFNISFEGSYGGFLAKLCTSDSWAGYTTLLKPAHYLKQFHLDYAEEIHGSVDAYYEFIAPFAAVMGYEDPKADGVWMYVFNQIDVINWEITNPNSCLTSQFFPGLIETDFPVLYAWKMIKSENDIQTYERNPYYWKVDAEGNQLPYLDYVTVNFVDNDENFTMDVITGTLDYSGVISADKMTLYLENEDAGNYVHKTAIEAATFGCVFMNINYGLNTDGTVKDDEDSAAWQEMMSDIRFRQALMLSIDAEETSDTIYNGFPIMNELYTCNHDIEKANALLDEMGAIDIDGDGYRETPSGKRLSWMAWMPTGFGYTSFAEFYVDYWTEIGLKCEPYVIDESILTTKTAANEVPMRIFYCNDPTIWYGIDWSVSLWAPLYKAWFDAGGLTGALDGTEGYLEPTEDVKEFYKLMLSTTATDINNAKDVVIPACAKYIADNLYIIMPILHTPGSMTYSKNLGNIPYNTDIMVHALNFDMDSFYFIDVEAEKD